MEHLRERAAVNCGYPGFPFCLSDVLSSTLAWSKIRLEANKSVPLPQYRLRPIILGVVVLPPSLLWSGWMGNEHATARCGV